MRWIILLALPLTLGSSGCTNSTRPDPEHPRQALRFPVDPASISDEQFASSVHRLLVSGEPTQERMNLLAGVVRRQLSHAKILFESGHEEEGLAAVTGALFLVRVGELRSEMYATQPEALAESADLVARLGDEGRAQALYSMLLETLPKSSPLRPDVEQHLASLSRWMNDTRGRTDLQSAASFQKSAARQSLLQPTPKTLNAARDSSLEWIRLAADKDLDTMSLRTPEERDEAVAAYRALSSGAAALAAVYLRHGDAEGALTALEQGEAPRLVRPVLREILEAAKEGDPEAWEALVRLFRRAEEPDRPETSLDPLLARGAAWGSALQLFRLEPSSMRGTIPIVMLLNELQLAEAAPLILAETLLQEGSARGMSLALNVVLAGVIEQDRLNNIPAARRIFRAASKLLTMAQTETYLGQVRPSPGRVQYVMGAIETRAGQLDAARPHVLAVVERAPTIEALGLLAAIDRQRGAEQEALRSLSSMAELAGKVGDSAAETRALAQSFEIHRDAGRQSDAARMLQRALERALEARRLARNNDELATAERILARVLEHYGDKRAARRATERAFAASGSDFEQLTATTLDAARRSFILADLKSGRDALQRALDANLREHDLIYVALWLQLLERRLSASSDGLVEEALERVDAGSGDWAAKLRQWGSGKLGNQDLVSAARTDVERTEARFYAALRADPKGGKTEELRAVAKSKTIELVEVMIARDLIAQQRGEVKVSLPPNVKVP